MNQEKENYLQKDNDCESGLLNTQVRSMNINFCLYYEISFVNDNFFKILPES